MNKECMSCDSNIDTKRCYGCDNYYCEEHYSYEVGQDNTCLCHGCLDAQGDPRNW